MKRRFKIGIAAITLASIMFTQSVPTELLEVLAEGIAESLTTEETINRKFYYGNMVDKYNIGNGYIIQENIENRTATTKEFLMSDDTIMVQQFVEPIHYYENGEYKDIDNSLIESTKNGKKIYKNNANSFKVAFDKGQSSFMEIEEDGYNFNFEYKVNTKQSSKVNIKNSEKKEEEQYKGKEYTRPNNIKVPNGQITYGSLEDDTNIVHTVKNKKLSSELVISKSKKEYSYTFELKSKNLKFEQSIDGSIYASNEVGQTKFIMPIPYMVDAKGTYSNAITYKLSEMDDGCVLTIIADSHWINETAEFPVSIVPEIKSAKTSSFKVANIYENGSNIVNADKVYVGKKNGTEKSDAFLNFKFPKVEPYYQLIGASVNFEYETQGMGLFNGKDLRYNVYLAESTSNLAAIANENYPSEIQKLNGIERNSQYAAKTANYSSDIINTTLVENETITLGIETSAETSADGYIALNPTSDSTSILCWYKRVIGIEDEYSMETFEIDGATSYINNGTGYLTSVIDLASVNTLSDMPFDVSLIYNDYYSDILKDIGKTSIVGNNFKLNFQQFIIQRVNDDKKTVYELIDADGSISTFHFLCSELYYSKEKKLYYNSSTNIVYDLLGNQMTFVNGRLTNISSTNNPSESIKVIYLSDNSDQIARLEYYFNSTVKYAINFTYSNGRIVSVTTNVGSRILLAKALEYNDDGNLVCIKNQTNNATGVEIISFDYYQDYAISGPVGTLKSIFNNQRNNIVFDRSYDTKIYKVRNLSSDGLYNMFRCTSSVEFGYYGIYTKIYYYENNVMTDERYVSFNNSREVIAEWQKDSNGIVSVQASTNWKNLSTIGSANYEKETCTYYHSTSSAEEIIIMANGGQWKQTIGAGELKVENHQNYSFAIVFKVVAAEVGEEVLAGISLKVKIGEDEAQDIILDYGGSTYIVVPCDYYETATKVIITNHGSENISVQHFAYALVNRVQESYTYVQKIEAHQLSSMTTSMQSGHYSHITYDNKHRIAKERTSEISTDKEEKTITYSYYDDSTDSNIEKGKIKSVSTTKANSADVEKTEYAYIGSCNDYTEMVTTTQGDDEMQTVYNINHGSGTCVVTQTDENNIQTKGYYKELSGDIRLWKLEYGDTREVYSYNNLGQITDVNVYEISSGTLVFSQTDNYDEKGFYLGSSYGGTKYTYGYENTGFITSIGYGSTGANDAVTPMLQYSYYGDSTSINSNKIERKTYANSDLEEYIYTAGYIGDVYGYRTQVNYRKSSMGTAAGSYIYNYNTKGAMTSQSYQINGATQISYDYGELDNLEQQTLKISGLEFNTEYTTNYDTFNNRIESTEIFSKIGCSTITNIMTSYTYDADGNMSKILYDRYATEYAYDSFGHLTGRMVAKSYGAQNIINENYIYETYQRTNPDDAAKTYTTSLLTCIEDETGNLLPRTAEYYADGSVKKIKYNGDTYEYTYDGGGRLKSEKKNNVIIAEYTYDQRNNVKTKTGGGVVTGFTYDAMDRLQDGNEYIYDAMGNPTVYKGETFEWEQGRKLVGGTLNGNSFAYNYDGNGMRYEKKVNGVKTSYYYNGDQLLMESKNGKRTWYIYGVTGIEGMIVEGGYQDEVYYFDKNTLGDIVAIRDESGDILATYSYDAWGNCTVMNGYGSVNTSSSFIGHINPFRYRGYYYDNETGFYYLQTRYYDPTICRFINADNFELISMLAGTYELNLYAYCKNNPIMYIDITGQGEVWDKIKNWLVRAGEGVEWFFDELKFVTDNAIESFYFNAGMGWGLGVGVEVSPIFSFELMAAQGGSLKALPVPQIGMFEKILASLNILQLINLSYGMDGFTGIGEPYDANGQSRIQDVTIGVGASAFIMIGGYWEFGFNVSQFSRLMGW